MQPVKQYNGHEKTYDYLWNKSSHNYNFESLCFLRVLNDVSYYHADSLKILVYQSTIHQYWNDNELFLLGSLNVAKITY